MRSDKITEEIMDAAPKLKIVVRAGAGFDNVDLAAATVRDIVVMNTPGQNSNAVAELVLGMLVFQARNHFNGKPGTELKGKKLGIQAYGHVGRNVARIAKGFGMEVFAFDPFVDKSRIEADGVVVFDNLEEMYKACDYISLHIPANAHTIKSINYDLLSKMKPGATLVNTARKEIIHEDDLLKILHERDNFSYISDISPDNRKTIENEFGDRCFFTPKKMGAQTAEANINAGTAAANQVIAFLEKGDTTFQVN
ncbi:D-3-phosphoglycerate dehydrogenase [hydrothermal vent metagenome]|uniref:D-3-phosphoglycerate dehydrogenase n=1 Tax=hydrothermal vent metagenome TaxID=652676 RepID=A0A3B0UY00_9ZZZZ